MATVRLPVADIVDHVDREPIMPTRRVGAIFAAMLLVATVSAQETRPAFEVASVKPQPDRTVYTAEYLSPRVREGGVFRVSHTTVEVLLRFAYDLPGHRIVGGPDWIRRELFQVDARAGREARAEEVKQMVRRLLEERFRLIAHTEQREMRLQELVLARPGEPLGPGLVRIDDCRDETLRDLRRKAPEKYPFPVGALIAGCSKSGLSDLATMISTGGTPVIDATGLTGSFYFSILSQWSMVAAMGLTTRSGPDPTLPELPTALREQLGVRLEARRGQVEVLVIDSVQEPSDN